MLHTSIYFKTRASSIYLCFKTFIFAKYFYFPCLYNYQNLHNLLIFTHFKINFS